MLVANRLHRNVCIRLINKNNGIRGKETAQKKVAIRIKFLDRWMWITQRSRPLQYYQLLLPSLILHGPSWEVSNSMPPDLSGPWLHQHQCSHIRSLLPDQSIPFPIFTAPAILVARMPHLHRRADCLGASIQTHSSEHRRTPANKVLCPTATPRKPPAPNTPLHRSGQPPCHP